MIIFILLYLHFHSVAEAMIVMASLPFALVGGVWLLYVLDYHLSVAVVVGFIALAGLAAETGVVMLVLPWTNRTTAGRPRIVCVPLPTFRTASSRERWSGCVRS